MSEQEEVRYYGRHQDSAEGLNLIRALIYEKDAAQEKEENPAVYMYIHIVMCMLENRAYIVCEAEKEELSAYLYQCWMEDKPMVEAAEQWITGWVTGSK